MNIQEEAEKSSHLWKNYVQLQGNNEDKDWKEFTLMEESILNNPDLECYRLGYNYAKYPTMLGFQNGIELFTFLQEDFLRLNQQEHLIPEDTILKENMLLVSEREAAFLNVTEGDEIENDYDKISAYLSTDHRLPVGPLMKRDAFIGCMVTQDTMYSNCYLVTWSEGTKKETFDQLIKQIDMEYPTIKVITYTDLENQLSEAYGVNNIIYYSIIVIIAIVFAITTNAVFVGVYEKRKKEFVLYEAIGIAKKRIYQKVAKEILLMDGVGILLGGILTIIIVSLLNQFLFCSQGLVMRYFNATAFYATLFCNVAIILPGILLRFKFIRKSKQWVD